jgi:hypothetical protein
MAYGEPGGKAKPGDKPAEPLCKRVERRLAQMKNERASYEPHWRELEENFAPRTGRWLRDQGSSNTDRGRKQHHKIINATPLFCVDTLAAGMTSGNTSPARPWFRLTTPDPGLAEMGSVKMWLHAVEMRMRDVFSRSNLYRVLPSIYRDLGVYGTACMLAIEDKDDVVSFDHLEIGSYWLAQSHRKKIDVMYREFPMTVRQMVQEFGLANVSPAVQNLHANGQVEVWRDVRHAIEPVPAAERSGDMAWRSVYWEVGATQKELAVRGFRTNPILGARWTTSGEDIYGSSPGMAALGEAKALQFKEKRKAQAIDKVVDPPLMAPTSLRNQKVSMLPGDVTYVDVQSGMQGLKPIHDWRPDLNAIREDVLHSEDQLRTMFYVDLFLMMQNDTRSNITAREIQERHEEKMLMLGPVVERVNDEVLDPLIDRVFDILIRRSMPYWQGLVNGEPDLPPPPPELGDVELKVEFISVLSQAQKAVGISSQDNLLGFASMALQTQALAGQIGGGVGDKLDFDQMIDERAEMLGVSPRIVRSDDDVQALRAERAQAEAQAKAAAMTAQMATVAKDLGQAKMGAPNDRTALGQAMDLAGAGAAS